MRLPRDLPGEALVKTLARLEYVATRQTREPSQADDAKARGHAVGMSRPSQRSPSEAWGTFGRGMR
jgi:hypothetical protein